MKNWGSTARGPQGLGIKSASINSAGHLIIKYDDANGTTQDAGLVSGTAGSTVRIGNGPPSEAVGSPGDVYIDAASGDLYGKAA